MIHAGLKAALFLVLGWLSMATLPAAADYPISPANLPVKTLDLTWHDSRRERDVPVRIYYPANGSSCPVILFSHGLGGSREGYAYLGETWAAHGYISVHLQHVGSDDDVWKGTLRPLKALRQAATDPENARNRPRDVSFAIDQLNALEGDAASPLHGRLDLVHIGLAGHSFGAYTTLATVTPGHRMGGYDPRIKAAIAMSTPASKIPEAYAGIKIPVFHLTGTEDVDQVGSVKQASDRRIPYDQTKSAPACLLTFAGGDHMVFSGPTARKKPDEHDLRFIAFIESSTLAFWDAELRGKTNARDWLLNGAFAAALGKDGVFEKKGW
jgi:predicted dienelactone hydrolase